MPVSKGAVSSLAGHTNDVNSVAFSPEGQHIVSGSRDKLVKVWSVSARKQVSVQRGNILFLEVETSW
jgi:WD40 repeat protein